MGEAKGREVGPLGRPEVHNILPDPVPRATLQPSDSYRTSLLSVLGD